MLETLHRQPAIIPSVQCEAEGCGRTCFTQIYTVELTRAKITREWVFCSLPCLRRGMAPVSNR